VVLKPAIVVSPNVLAVGHVLSRDCYDENASLIAQAGCVVDHSLMLRVRSKGVPVSVVSVEPACVDGDAANMAESARINHLFRHWRLSPGMNNLHSLILDHRMAAKA